MTIRRPLYKKTNHIQVYCQVSVRLEPRFRRMLDEIVHTERRSISATVEQLIGAEYMRRNKLKELPAE